MFLVLGAQEKNSEGEGVKELKTPLTEEDIKSLNAGEQILLSGEVVTARDRGHRLLRRENVPLPFNVIYHCGPIIKDGEIVSAGPTTSSRMEPYMADVVKRHGVRAVIGKGGMGEKTSKALREHGCVYLAVTGGAGALLASKVKKVLGSYLTKEYGMAEGFWHLEIEDMPLTVAVDAQGKSLYEDVRQHSLNALNRFLSTKP